MSVVLICIVKNEAPFLAEWIAHNLALGFDRIFIFDNESTDETAAIIKKIGEAWPVEYRLWPSRAGSSPQIDAYNWAMTHVASTYDWVTFFDCDEFLVLHKHEVIGDFLTGFGTDIGAIGINWLGFGSSGQENDNYGLVTDTFIHGAKPHAGNNQHIKTIARTKCVTSMVIHHAILREGRYVHPNGQSLGMSNTDGLSNTIEHSTAQLNHYQIKSRVDFDRKIARGRAGLPANDPQRIRPPDEADRIFRALDHNQVEYSDIRKHRAAFDAIYSVLFAGLSTSKTALSTPRLNAIRTFLNRFYFWGCRG